MSECRDCHHAMETKNRPAKGVFHCSLHNMPVLDMACCSDWTSGPVDEDDRVEQPTEIDGGSLETVPDE